jgi:hypothetical protein
MKNTQLASVLGSSLIACALAIGSLVSTQSALAQSSAPLAKVNIPFAFQAGSKAMPAGMYQIDREARNLILLHGPGQAAAYMETSDAIKVHAPDHGNLLFARYGNTYFLRQIWTAGNPIGLECPKSRLEKESLQANSKQAPSSTEVAINGVPQH